MSIQKYIQLTDKVKIINPCFDCDVTHHDGDLINFDFTNHNLTFQKLNEILQEYNVKFSYIWYGEFRNDNNRIYNRFLLKSECGRVFWRKYSTKNPGSSQNLLYVDGNKFQTMKVLRNTNLISSFFNNT
jgi:hypothetical protein|tara:strand:+ start:226 stop:612 length:387 start_codon:yes stop_codon:yes gene_type:complete